MGRDTRRLRILLAVLLITAFTLITLDYRSGVGSGARSVAHTVFGPIADGVTTVTRPIGRTLSSIVHLGRDRKRAERLARENADLKRQLAASADASRQAAALARLRLVADRGQYTIVPTRVIAVGDVSDVEWTVTINAGRGDGVVPSRLVMDEAGLVGSVVSATAHTAVVRLACDPDSHIGARLEGTRLLGKVDGGAGASRLTFTLYDTSLRVRPGDRLVTYGSLDYAPGVPIGEVVRVLDGGEGLSRTTEVRPYVTFGSLDTLAVIVGRPATDPGDRVLPPRPAPAGPAGAPSPAPTP